MSFNRRRFLKTATVGSVVSLMLGNLSTSCSRIQSTMPDYIKIDEAFSLPVLNREFFPNPVIIETLELLRHGDSFICRVRSTDGAEGLSVSNNMQMVSLYPIFVLRLQNFFIGTDARDLEKTFEMVYVHDSNYKLQGLALWIPLATIEFAILDCLGKIAGKPIGELIGNIHNPEIAVYQANNFRGKSAEESLERIKKQVEESHARAIKFKVGGRMNSPEEPTGRSEKLIPMIRDAFGPDMTIYADSNGSYDVAEAIRIGKILQEHKVDFYEEPVPFDWYHETLDVAANLNIPIAGGEQEPSMRNFRWLIGNHALDIVQPDIFYFGGMVRSMRVARMANVMGKTCVPHISGSGLGYLYMMHFVSAVPNAGPYHEFKGFNDEIPLECDTSDLQSHNGIIKVPTGPGLGVRIDPDYLKMYEVVKA